MSSNAIMIFFASLAIAFGIFAKIVIEPTVMEYNEDVQAYQEKNLLPEE